MKETIQNGEGQEVIDIHCHAAGIGAGKAAATDMPVLNTTAVSPLYFAHVLGLKKAVSIRSIANPWDRDVRLKEALGVPDKLFGSTSAFLKGNPNTVTGSEER